MSQNAASTTIPRLLNDFHVHTYLARCCSHKDTQTPANIVQRAASLGFQAVGFSEHCHYPQDKELLARLKSDVSALDPPLRVFAGCEADYAGDGKTSLTRDDADRLGMDFVVLATSHFHIGHIPRPARSDPRSAAEHWLRFLREGIRSDVADIIAHPVLNLSNALGDLNRIMDTLSDAEILEVLEEARARNVAMDVNPRLFASPCWSAETQVRFYRLCKRAAVQIAPASDAHQLSQIGDTLKLQPWAETIGLSNDDFIDADWLTARRRR